MQGARDPYRWTRLSSFSSLGLLVVGIAGLALVLGELNQLTKQNEVLEGSLRQTFRPLGVATYSPDNTSDLILKYIPTDSRDKFSFVSDRALKNLGQGLLSYLGSFSHLSTEEQDFRTLFLEGEIDTVNFDGLYTYARRSPVLPGESFPTSAVWQNLPFERRYFFYTIFLYLDQDGALYDTERSEVLRFKDPWVEGDRLKVELEGGCFVRETYHFYSLAERSRLASRLRDHGHEGLANLVESDR